jgi:diguanylate cyclase (GGDEF)-like protein
MSDTTGEYTSNITQIRGIHTPNRELAKQTIANRGITDTGLVSDFAKVLTRKELQGQQIDSLTGLLNRDGFEKKLQQEVNRAKRFGNIMTLVFLDVNDLKKTNDSQGHEAGDTLIKNVANVLKANGRDTDILARYGDKADEFVVVLAGTSLHESKEFLNRISKDFDTSNISVAGGAAQLDTRAIPESKRHAELAMYKAKAASKSQGSNRTSIMYTTDDLTNNEFLDVA